MYDIALSVAACVRSGTRADVAWMLAPTASDEAIAFTPGGGRIGALCNGAFDGVLADVAARQLHAGRLVRHTVTEWESVESGIPPGTTAEFLVVPAAQFPKEVWNALVERRPVAVDVRLADREVKAVTVATDADTTGGAEDLLRRATSTVQRSEGHVLTVLVPVTRLVVAGGGPIAQALAANARLLGWKVSVESRPDHVMGLTAPLSVQDAVVVMGHDVESSSRALMAALESDAGYIGALGSRAMQQNRADWLAYRDVTDLSRVHGPAGLDIAARTEAEIAVAILAEALAVLAARA